MIETLIRRLEAGHLSQNEETLAANLAAVAVTQIQREGTSVPLQVTLSNA